MAAKQTVQIQGAKLMAAKLKALGRAWPKAVRKALHQESSLIMTKMVDRTPVDKGILAGSFDLKTERKPGEIKAIIQVGGPAISYAIRVHEDASMHHNNGEAFFMKKEIDAQRPKFSENMAKRIKANHGLE